MGERGGAGRRPPRFKVQCGGRRVVHKYTAAAAASQRRARLPLSGVPVLGGGRHPTAACAAAPAGGRHTLLTSAAAAASSKRARQRLPGGGRRPTTACPSALGCGRRAALSKTAAPTANRCPRRRPPPTSTIAAAAVGSALRQRLNNHDVRDGSRGRPSHVKFKSGGRPCRPSTSPVTCSHGKCIMRRMLTRRNKTINHHTPSSDRQLSHTASHGAQK